MSNPPIQESLSRQIKALERRLAAIESGSHLRNSSVAGGEVTVTDKVTPGFTPTPQHVTGKHDTFGVGGYPAYGTKLVNDGTIFYYDTVTGHVVARIGKLPDGKVGIETYDATGKSVFRTTQDGGVEYPFVNVGIAGACTYNEHSLTTLATYNTSYFHASAARLRYALTLNAIGTCEYQIAIKSDTVGSSTIVIDQQTKSAGLYTLQQYYPLPEGSGIDYTFTVKSRVAGGTAVGFQFNTALRCTK